MAKRISIYLECDVNDSATEEQVSERIREALKGLAGDAGGIGDLQIGSVDREKGAAAGAALAPGGYNSRLWSKATC